jgi:hypothetical protein
MELPKIRELIKKAKMASTNPDSLKLAENFEDFVELYHMRDEMAGDPDFVARLGAAHREFWSSFSKVATSFGFTPEKLKESFEDRNSYTAEQWDDLQTLKQEIETKPATASKLLKRNNNHKMRI